jgi:hypothetical protein
MSGKVAVVTGGASSIGKRNGDYSENRPSWCRHNLPPRMDGGTRVAAPEDDRLNPPHATPLEWRW